MFAPCTPQMYYMLHKYVLSGQKSKTPLFVGLGVSGISTVLSFVVLVVTCVGGRAGKRSAAGNDDNFYTHTIGAPF